MKDSPPIQRIRLEYNFQFLVWTLLFSGLLLWWQSSSCENINSDSGNVSVHLVEQEKKNKNHHSFQWCFYKEFYVYFHCNSTAVGQMGFNLQFVNMLLTFSATLKWELEPWFNACKSGINVNNDFYVNHHGAVRKHHWMCLHVTLLGLTLIW